MKNECKELLEEYIFSCCKEKGKEYDFYTLFKHFSAYEISREEDILPAIDEFFAFLEKCEQVICKSDIHNPPKLVRYSADGMKRFFSIPLSAGQKKFADLVTTIAPCKDKTGILDVGAGLYPKTALYMARANDNISAMDKKFILSAKSMKAMRINSYQQMFDVNAQIKDYDFIVGRNPCYAIANMVQLCVKENKPYLIELCNCALPKGFRVSSPSFGWEKILKEYDPHIKIGGDGYAYNIDASERQIKRVLAKADNRSIIEVKPRIIKPLPLNINDMAL